MMQCRWLSGVMFLSLLSFPFFAAAEPAVDQPADVRILVDISGSMKQTDPQNLRIPAVNLLIELLPDQAQGGVWTFGRYVNMLVPPAPVDEAWRRNAKEQARSISSAGLYTNLTEALERARWKVKADSGYRHSLILLTDGRIDMREPGMPEDTDACQRQQLLQQILPEYVKAGARIHTLALSDAADKELLQQIALETGGLFLEARTADDLLKAFLKAFDRAVPADQVPMQDNRFVIDDSVKEFTALIFRQPDSQEARLIAPDGRTMSMADASSQGDLRWYRELNFELITVSAPQAGEWRVDALVDPDNRVQILSDLRLQVSGIPDALFAGVPVELATTLQNAGEVIRAAELLRGTHIDLKVTAPDGRSGSKRLSDGEAVPADGVYRETMSRLSQQGEYRFEITASGRTFQRSQVLTAVLMEPLLVDSEERADEQLLRITVEPQSDISIADTRIMARITAPDDHSVIQTMTYLEAENVWQLDVAPDNGPGLYSVALNIRGVTSGGTEFRVHPDDIRATFPLGVPAIVLPSTAAQSAVPVAAAEPEAEADAAAEAPAPDTEAAPAEAEAPAEPVAAPEPAVVPEPVVPEPAEAAPEDAAESGVAWWVYLLIGLANLLVFGGAAAWWLLRHRRRSEPAEAGQGDRPARAVPEDLIREDITDEEQAGSFDDFAGEEEEEIPLPSSVPSGAGDDMDMPVSLDDDFNIDPDDDDWGEFDPEHQAGDEESPQDKP